LRLIDVSGYFEGFASSRG